MKESKVSLILVKEEFIDKISFPDWEKIEDTEFDSSARDAVQLTNTSSLQDFEKSIQKIAKSNFRVAKEHLAFSEDNCLNSISPTTFLEFSELDMQNSNEVKNFMLNYGLLYSKHKALIDTSKKRVSELVGVWALLQNEIQTLVKLWRAVKASTGQGVDSMLSLSVAGLISKANPFEIKNYNSPLLSSTYNNLRHLDQESFKVSFENMDDKKFLSSPDRRIHDFASKVLEEKLNKLLNLFQPEITFDSKRFTLGRKGQRGLLSLYDTKQTTLVQHTTLFSAVLFQLLDSIDKEKEYKKCLECLNWIELSNKGKDGNRYCCATCRNKASRRRRDIELLFAAWPVAIENFQTFFEKIGDNFRQLRAGEQVNWDAVIQEISTNSLGDQSDTLKSLSIDLLLSYTSHAQELVASDATKKHFGFEKLKDSGAFDKIFAENLVTSRTGRGFTTPYYDWSFTGYD